MSCFMWTIGDVFALALSAFGVLFFGGLFAVIRVADWSAKRRRVKAAPVSNPHSEPKA